MSRYRLELMRREQTGWACATLPALSPSAPPKPAPAPVVPQPATPSVPQPRPKIPSTPQPSPKRGKPPPGVCPVKPPDKSPSK